MADLRIVQRSFDDAVRALGNIVNPNKAQSAKDAIHECWQRVRTLGGFPAAVDVLQSAEAAVVYPTDGVALGLVNQAHAMIFDVA